MPINPDTDERRWVDSEQDAGDGNGAQELAKRVWANADPMATGARQENVLNSPDRSKRNRLKVRNRWDLNSISSII